MAPANSKLYSVFQTMASWQSVRALPTLGDSRGAQLTEFWVEGRLSDVEEAIQSLHRHSVPGGVEWVEGASLATRCSSRS
jgi:hypothetical protein